MQFLRWTDCSELHFGKVSAHIHIKQTQAVLKIGLNHQAGWSYHDIIASAIYGQR